MKNSKTIVGLLLFMLSIVLLSSCSSDSNESDGETGGNGGSGSVTGYKESLEIKIFPDNQNGISFTAHAKEIYIEWGNGKIDQENPDGEITLTHIYDGNDKAAYIKIKAKELSDFTVKRGEASSIILQDCSNIKELECGEGKKLAVLSLLNTNKLEKLNCSNGALSVLNLKRCENLKYLNCSYNLLKSLDISENAKLENIDCSNNEIATIKFHKNSSLQSLDCSFNLLKTLNLDENKGLQYLNCENNALDYLELTNNLALKSIYCGNNEFKTKTVRLGENHDNILLSPTKESGIYVWMMDHSDSKSLEISFPRSLFRVDIEGNVSQMNSGTKAKIILRFDDNQGSTFTKYATAKIQGNSTQAQPKKNYSIQLFNDKDEDSKFKLRIGNWISINKFHLKAQYADCWHSADIVNNRIYEQMRQTKPYDEQKPWRPGSNNGTAASDDGALGHVDGYACEVYINNEYWGIYNFNLSKERENYNQEKKNQDHIHFDFPSHQPFGGNLTPIWNRLKMRNPSGFDEQVVLPEGKVRSSIERIWKWSYNMTDADFVKEYDDYIVIDYWIDWILFTEMTLGTDLITKNTQWLTYDGKRWLPLPYDLKFTYAMHYAAQALLSPDMVLTNDLPIVKKIKANFSYMLQDRYRELRNSGIFTVDNIIGKFEEFENIIGKEAYGRDIKRWPSMPSVVNPNYRTSIAQKSTWLTRRFQVMDKMYNY